MPDSDPANPLLVERRDQTLVVTLHRPHRGNALDETMLTALRALWRDEEILRGIRCIVITGAGRVFCGGADMSLLSGDRSAAPDSAAQELSFLPGLEVDCPVIVAVNGACAGGGLHFVADADIAIAADDAVFVDPHVSVGQVSALEPLTLLPRAQFGAVMRMVLLGSAEQLTADQALAAGLVSEVVSTDRLQDRAMELASAIAANSPAAVAVSRRVVRSAHEAMLASALEDGWGAIRRHWEHPDAAEGPAAFMDKRRPRWSEA